LFYEFKILSPAGCLILEAYSVSHGKASPYLPVIELLKSYFDIQVSDVERKRREKVTGKVLTLDRSLEDTLPYLFALLGIEEQPSPLQQMDPQIRRRRTFEALKKLFLRESLNQPLVLIFEDLHWIDSETQGFLDTLSEGVASAKILLLVNYRPEYRHEWSQKTYYSQVRLAPFGQAEAEEFLDSLLGDVTAEESPRPTGERARVRGDNNLQSLKQLILAKTEGTPFFMEEVVQTLIEDGTLEGEQGTYTLTRPVVTLQLPTTVQGVLAARIDRLMPDEKALLQQLAVIGREFPLSLLRRVIPQSEDDLDCLLASLQHKEFLYEQPAFPEVEYIFKHALTQEVAYGTVLQERRKTLHEQTAQAIESLYHINLEDHYSELAHHYSRSGNTPKAIEYLQQAGQRAIQRSANAEAIRHLTTALELLKTLPDTPARTHQELMLQTALGSAVIAAKGYTAVEVERAFTRARELSQQIGETPQLFPVLTGLFVFHLIRGEFQFARELAEQCLSLAQRLQSPDLCFVAHEEIGETWFWLGELPLAYAQFDQALALADRQQPHYPWAWIDYVATCQSYTAISLWLLGYPDQALKKSQAALTRARELAHPLTLVSALHWAGLLHQYRGEGQLAQQWAEAEITLATEQGFPDWQAWGTALQGWALAEQGQGEESIVRICQGVAALRAKGAEHALVLILAVLAEIYEKRGQIEEGLAALAEAWAMVDRTRGYLFEAELYRLKGELTLQSSVQSLESSVKEAEACFLKAIDIAQRQQAKSLELRAVMSLVRLRQHQSQDHVTRTTQHVPRAKLDDVHKMLSEIYNWFTEGFDTKDLQEAKVLLDALV
jgi:tetratricopeptide (TPR) repeat protein